MAESFGDLVIALRADASGFAADLNKGKRSLGGFVKGSVRMLADIGLAANTVKSAFGAMIGPMQEAQEAALAERKLAQVFKSTGEAAGIAKDEVMAFAAERQKLTSFDADDTVNAAAILGSFTNVKGSVFTEALTSAQDLSAFMGQDLQSSIRQVGKALNDPAKGIAALARSGIQFSESQKQEIKALQETGQIAKAQAIILKEMQTQFGGQAKALVDPIKQAENAWGDAMETIGAVANEKLLPLMPKLIAGFEGFSNIVIKTVEKLGEMAESVQYTSFVITALGSGMSLKDAKAAYDEAFGIKAKDAGVGGMFGALQAGLKKQEEEKEIATAAAAAVKTQEMQSAGKIQAEAYMRDWIGSGLSGLENAYMSLGPPGMEEKAATNQVGSLERNSQEAFDVLRANVGPGGKDVQKDQLAELKKLNKLQEKIEKKLGRKMTGREEANFVIGQID
jgi:hypothetical protein